MGGPSIGPAATGMGRASACARNSCGQGPGCEDRPGWGTGTVDDSGVIGPRPVPAASDSRRGIDEARVARGSAPTPSEPSHDARTGSIVRASFDRALVHPCRPCVAACGPPRVLSLPVPGVPSRRPAGGHGGLGRDPRHAGTHDRRRGAPRRGGTRDTPGTGGTFLRPPEPGIPTPHRLTGAGHTPGGRRDEATPLATRPASPERHPIGPSLSPGTGARHRPHGRRAYHSERTLACACSR